LRRYSTTGLPLSESGNLSYLLAGTAAGTAADAAASTAVV